MSSGIYFLSESFNCHESLLWEGFVTPIYAGGFRAPLFRIMHSENRKMNGSDFLLGSLSSSTGSGHILQGFAVGAISESRLIVAIGELGDATFYKFN